ncbi:MAG: fimbrillin family protein [Alistipes senegalensis]|nr:fimbrillin family protein [Bacteroides cellulosilyticus]MCM1352987.1 fimbrillin family protein [Alistipes senegalensis]
MKKELTKAVLAVVLGFFATACTSDAPIEPVTPDSELVEIMLNGGVSFAVSPDAKAALPASRAVINKKHGEVALAFARVDATAAGASATYPAWSSTTAGEVKCLNATLAENTDEDNPAKGISFGTTQFYLANAYYTKLVGWAPSVNPDSEGNSFAGTASTFSAGTVTCPIDGETDIMLSQELQGNKEAANRFSAANPFVFKHLLTQIKVSAYAADKAGKTQWGNITNIKVKGEANKECKIVLPGTDDGAVTYALQSGKTADNLPLVFKKASDDSDIIVPPASLPIYYDGETGAPADYKQECGYAMFAPVAAVSGEATITLLVSTKGGPDGHAVTDQEVPVKVSSADGFKAGTAYGVTLKFSAQTIGISGTVEEWKEYDWDQDPDNSGEITL